MSRWDAADEVGALREKVRELEAENAKLRSQLEYAWTVATVHRDDAEKLRSQQAQTHANGRVVTLVEMSRDMVP